jgi:hypothetical protein
MKQISIMAIKTNTKVFFVLTALILGGSGYSFSQNTKINVQSYLEAYTTIKGRAMPDLTECIRKSKSDSPEGKVAAIKMKDWSEEKKSQMQDLFRRSITDYSGQVHMDVSEFMTVISSFGEEYQKKQFAASDFRVQKLGDDKYVGEFYCDLLLANSEENAVISAHELAQSPYAKKHPDSDIGNVEVIKKTYADERKLIEAGKHPRYATIMALLYTRAKDGTIIFNDPFQAGIDFVNK